jgi:hypothetical protein
MNYKKYLKEGQSRDEYLDKLGTKKLKPRIDNTVKELKDILRYMEVSTDAHLYSKKFKKLIINIEKFSNNFNPKFQKVKSSSVFPYI